jgi:hypothetical protein
MVDTTVWTWVTSKVGKMEGLLVKQTGNRMVANWELTLVDLMDYQTESLKVSQSAVEMDVLKETLTVPMTVDRMVWTTVDK